MPEYHAFKIGSTTVIDSSRNLTNIGTISSGEITSTGSGDQDLTINSTNAKPRVLLQENGTTKVFLESLASGVSGQFGIYSAAAGKYAFLINTSGNTSLNGGTLTSGAITSSGAMTINEGNAFTDLNIKSDRTSGNIGGVNFVNASNAIKGQVFGNTDGTVYFYSGGQTEALRLDSSQNATFAGTISSGNITVSGTYPKITLTDTDNNPDFTIIGGSGQFGIYDETNSAYRLQINSSGNATFAGAITSGSNITSNSFMQIVGASGSSGFMYIYDRDNGTSNTDGFLLQKSGNNAFVYNRESSGSLKLGAGDTNNYLVIDSDGNIDLGSTQILDQSRNLTNIGTISSTDFTTNGAAVVVQNKNLTVVGQPINISANKGSS